MGFSDIALSAFSTRRFQLGFGNNLAEIACPIIERLQACVRQEGWAEIALHYVQFRHRVRNGRSRGYTLSTQRTPIQSQSVEIPR